MSRTVLVVMLIAAALAVAVLTGCLKPQQAELQGAPAAGQPPAGGTPMPEGGPMPAGQHTMAGGQKMAGDQEMTGKQMEGMKGGEGMKAQPAAAGKGETASCPVLGTTMPKAQMIPLEYKGKTYYFCCSDCVTKFKANPEKYIKQPAKPLPLGAPMPMSGG